MISVRIRVVPILCGVLLAAPLCAGDLSTYREFQFGSDLTTVANQVGMDPSEAKAVHQRPAVIQELEWRRHESYDGTSEVNPVEKLFFRFYNGELCRIVVNYDRSTTEGMTAEDMVEVLSAEYGTGTTPATELVFPTIFKETVKAIASWEDPQHSFNLVRSSYQSRFGMIMYSKRLDALAEAATVEAIRLDRQEAPQKEIERQMREARDDRVRLEKTRELNRERFLP